MLPPILEPRRLELPDGRVYQAKPVMLMFYHIDLVMEGIQKNQMQVKDLYNAMKSGMHFFHTDEEIWELMGEAYIPEIIDFLMGPVDEEQDGIEESIADDFLGTEELTDAALTAPPSRRRSTRRGEPKSPSAESDSE